MKNDEETRRLALVADDDADVRALIALALERSGYRVLEAGEGEQALRLALDHEPDLVVLDVKMPKLDGCEVTELLREAEARRRPSIILVSASVSDAQVERGFAAGADAYVTKPFSPKELRATAETTVEGHERREER